MTCESMVFSLKIRSTAAPYPTRAPNGSRVSHNAVKSDVQPTGIIVPQVGYANLADQLRSVE
jgi:hypothetical protein